MTWTRQPLSQYAAGYDAVVQFAAPVVNQVVSGQAGLALPALTAGPVSVPVAAPAAAAGPIATLAGAGGMAGAAVAGTGTGGQVATIRSIVVNLVAAVPGPIRLLGAAAQATGSDVVVQLTLRNETGATVILVAAPRLGNLARPTSPPQVFGVAATGVLAVPVPNVPAVTSPIEIRVFDLNQPGVELVLQGDLAVTTLPRVSVGNTSVVGPPGIPGLENRVTRTLVVQATPSRFAIDLAASTGAQAVLTSPVSLAIEAITTEALVALGPFGSIFDDQGRLNLNTAADVQYSIDRRTVTAELRLVAPLATAVDPATSAVDVSCDLSAASLTLRTVDPYAVQAATAIVAEFTAALAVEVGRRPSGARLALAPRLSLVGALRTGQTVAEISIGQTRAEVLPATASGDPSVLCVAVALAGNTQPRTVLTNFLGSGTIASVISGAVVRAGAGFRWRTGDYPKVLPGRPNESQYDDHGTRVAILIYPQIRQTSLVDVAGAPVPRLRAAGSRTYGTSTGVYTFLMTDAMATVKAHPEDHVLLGGLGSFEIAAVVRKDNHQPVPDDVRKAFEVPAELRDVLFEWSFSMSSVAPPAPIADPNVDAFVQAMRTAVTSHLSRPFAEPHSVVLIERAVNALDDLMLSRGTLTIQPSGDAP